MQSVQGKQGRSGTLNFVVVDHQILQGSNEEIADKLIELLKAKGGLQ